MARTQIKLNQLIQDGATSNQVISWNGSNWTPSTVTGDGNGIYSGSGTVPTNTVATVTDTLTFRETVAANAGVVTPLIIDVRTSNVSGGAATFGTGLLFTAETTTTESREIFGLETSWTTSADATRTSAVAFRLPSGGAYATRLTLNPSSLVPASTFTIGGTSDLTIGGSTGRAVLQSSANSADAILLNVNGLTNSSGITMVGANTFTNTGGAKVGVTINGSFVPTTGSATWTSMSITPTINQSTGGTGITRGLHINPSLNTPADFRALEIGNTLANTYGIHQSGLSVLNMLAGNTGIGIAPGTNKLHVSGSIRFDLGSDAQGDIFYRNSSGNFVRLPIGTNGHVLTSNGTIPGWSAPGAGSNGIYGGSGTIALAAVATVTSGSTFTIDYNDGKDAFLVDDANGNVSINAKAASSGTLQVNDVGVALGGAATDGIVYIDQATFALTAVDSYTPATSQNNYAIADGTSRVRINGSANIDITGISQTTSTSGRILIIHNVSPTYSVTLKNESASSTATNRLALGTNEVYDIVLGPNNSHTLIYDGTSSRWRSLVTDTSGSSATNLAFSGASSPVTLTSSTGTDVTFTAGTGISLSATSGNITITNASAGVTDHGALTGLSDDDHSIYALLAGRSSGQTLKGGTGTTDVLSLVGTSGNGTATNAAIQLKVGNNGATTALTVLNNASIGIGTAAPHSTALVDMNSTTQGLGIPTMTEAQRDSISFGTARNGLVVYNTTSNKLSLRANGAWEDVGGSSGPPLLQFNSQSGTSYTLVIGDAGKMIRASNAATVTITIPPNADVAFSTGTVIYVEQTGAGTVQISPGSGVTILTSAKKTIGQYATMQVYKVDTNTWNVIGGSV